MLKVGHVNDFYYVTVLAIQSPRKLMPLLGGQNTKSKFDFADADWMAENAIKTMTMNPSVPSENPCQYENEQDLTLR